MCVCLCVCDCVLRFCLNYGNMPKICFSLWPAISSRLPFRFAFCWFMAFIGQVLCLFVVHCFGQFFVSCCCRLGFELLISSAPWSDCYAIYIEYIQIYLLYMSAIYILPFMQIFCCFLSGCVAARRCHIYLMVFLFLN